MNDNSSRAKIRPFLNMTGNEDGKAPFYLRFFDILSVKGLFNYSKLKITARPESSVGLTVSTNGIRFKNEILDFNDYSI